CGLPTARGPGPSEDHFSPPSDFAERETSDASSRYIRCALRPIHLLPAAWLRNGRPPFLDNNAGSRRRPRPSTQDAPAAGWRPSDPILTPTLRRVFERRPFQSQGGVMSEVLTAPITAVARLQPAEHTMKLAGGMELFYRAWLPTAPARKAVLF